MVKKFRKVPPLLIVPVLLALMLALGLALPAMPALAQGRSMSIVPSTQTVDPGDTFDVTIMIDTDVATRGAQCYMAFDAALVEVVSVDEGTFYSDWAATHGATTFFSDFANHGAGTVGDLGVAILGGDPGGPTGSGSFAIIHMKAKDGVEGTSPLTLLGVLITDDQGAAIEGVVINDGEVVVGVGPTPTPTPTPEDSVSLGATILPAVSISVEPTSIDFGELVAGDISDPNTITITNLGGKSVDVTAEVTGDSLFVDGLWLDSALWNAYEATIAKCDSTTTDATLHVPDDYIETGDKEGTLIFWAEVH